MSFWATVSQVLSSHIHPDPAKVKSFRIAEIPEDKSEIRSFLGMTNFSSRFIKNYSTLTHELRKLTHEDVSWEWNEKQQYAFDTIRNQLYKNSVLNYFNINLKTEMPHQLDLALFSSSTAIRMKKGIVPILYHTVVDH